MCPIVDPSVHLLALPLSVSCILDASIIYFLIFWKGSLSQDIDHVYMQQVKEPFFFLSFFFRWMAFLLLPNHRFFSSCSPFSTPNFNRDRLLDILSQVKLATIQKGKKQQILTFFIIFFFLRGYIISLTRAMIHQQITTVHLLLCLLFARELSRQL